MGAYIQRPFVRLNNRIPVKFPVAFKAALYQELTFVRVPICSYLFFVVKTRHHKAKIYRRGLVC